MPEHYCSILSAQAGETLFGTANRTDHYLLVEYNHAWEDKALPKSSIPEEVKQRVNSLSKSLPYTKTLLIKQSSNPTALPLHCFLAAASENHPRLYRFQINSYHDILDLPIEEILQGSPAFSEYLDNDPLYLVCTNGRRDVCCSRFGFAVFEKLKKVVGGAAWECTHLGGHRFAVNLIHLPDGIFYGRVHPQDVAGLVEQIQIRKMHLENLRGRTAYSDPAQAAEYFLRKQTGELNLDAYRLVNAAETETGAWQIHFRSNLSGVDYKLTVALVKSAAEVYDSCAFDKLTPMKTYYLQG